MNKLYKKLSIVISVMLVFSCMFQLNARALEDFIQTEDITESYEPTEYPTIIPTEYPTIIPIEYPTDPIEITEPSESTSHNTTNVPTEIPVISETDNLEIMPVSTETTAPTEWTEPTELTEPTEIFEPTEPQPPIQTSPTYNTEEPTIPCISDPTTAPGYTEPWETDPTNRPIVTPQLIVLPHKTTISLSSSKGSVYVKGTKQIKATVKYGRGETTYKSLNLSVAKVSSGGKITGVKKGKAIIVIKNNGAVTHYTITVNNPKLNITGKTIRKGKTFTISVIGKVGTPKFSSTNKRVAKVNSGGKVKGKKRGKCYINVKTNGIKLRCKVKVK
ncbi:MAG: Ig-like domain-containing protein [Ruminococcus sp.]